MSVTLPDAIWRLRLRTGAVFGGISVLVLALGSLEAVRALSGWFGFAGTLLLLVPALYLEFSKLEISQLRRTRARDSEVRAGIECELSAWESDLARYRAWHGWCLCVGLALLALAFRSTL
jgi:hypothetical protein